MIVYLLTFHDMWYFDQTDVNFLDSRSEILNWLAFHPSVFIVSQHNAYQLAAIFRQAYPNKQFIINQVVRGDNDGSMPQQVWDFINNPAPKPGKGPTVAPTLFDIISRNWQRASTEEPGGTLAKLLGIPKDKNDK